MSLVTDMIDKDKNKRRYGYENDNIQRGTEEPPDDKKGPGGESPRGLLVNDSFQLSRGHDAEARRERIVSPEMKKC